MRQRDWNKIQKRYQHDLTMQKLVALQPVVKPYVDAATATVYWGTESKKGMR